MANIITLNKLLKENNYIASRKQLSEKNFSGQQIKKYLKDNVLVLLDKGIYGSCFLDAI